MKGRVILALSLTVNLGLLGWLGLQLNYRSKPPLNLVVKVVTPIVSPIGPLHSPPPAASAPVQPPELCWRQIESEDYPTHITNLRTIAQDIRQSAEQALRQTLGDKALTDYLEQDAAQWLR
jgi:hypothetical protein